MKSLAPHCVLGGKLKPRLKAGDRLMLGAVIHKGALDVLHKRDEPKVENKYNRFCNTLYHRAVNSKPSGEKIVDKVGGKYRQKHKQAKGKHNAQNKRDRHNKRGGRLVLLRLLFYTECLCGFLERFKGKSEHLDEIHDAADKGQVKYFAFFSYGGKRVVEYDEAAVLLAAGGYGAAARLHHNSLKNSLSANLV